MIVTFINNILQKCIKLILKIHIAYRTLMIQIQIHFLLVHDKTENFLFPLALIMQYSKAIQYNTIH